MSFISLFPCLLCFGGEAINSTQDREMAALLERVQRLEARAAQADAMADEIQELRQEVSMLHGKLGTSKTDLNKATLEPVLLPPSGVDPDTDLRRKIEEVLADWPKETSPTPLSDYGDGLNWSFWGWLTYLRVPQQDLSTFWAWESELDVTKSFTERISAGGDIQFIDQAGGQDRLGVEQLFLSVLISECHETLFTAGKFNAPFGAEPRDFWDRLTGSTSLLFKAQPQDLTGVMITQPVCEKTVILRPFVVNGFDHDLDVNEQPSAGLMAEYRPNKDFSFAVTNWTGPELPAENGDKLYFLDVEAKWWPMPTVSLAGEYLLATTESPGGNLAWTGFLVLVNHDFDDCCRVFGRWSFLNDPDGFITKAEQQVQELSAGLAYYLHPHVEFRCEYRHDFSQGSEDLDMLSAHFTFGF